MLNRLARANGGGAYGARRAGADAREHRYNGAGWSWRGLLCVGGAALFVLSLITLWVVTHRTLLPPPDAVGGGAGGGSVSAALPAAPAHAQFGSLPPPQLPPDPALRGLQDPFQRLRERTQQQQLSQQPVERESQLPLPPLTPQAPPSQSMPQPPPPRVPSIPQPNPVLTPQPADPFASPATAVPLAGAAAGASSNRAAAAAATAGPVAPTTIDCNGWAVEVSPGDAAQPASGLVLHWPEQRFSVTGGGGRSAHALQQCQREVGPWNLRVRSAEERVQCDEVVHNPSFLFTFYYFFGGSNYFHIHIDTLVPLYHALRTRGLLDAQRPAVPPLLIPVQLKDGKSGGGPNFAATSNDPAFHHSKSKFGYPFWNEAFQTLTSNPLRPLHHRYWRDSRPPPPPDADDPAPAGPLEYSTDKANAAVEALAAQDRAAGRSHTVCFAAPALIGVSSYNPRVVTDEVVREMIDHIKTLSLARFARYLQRNPPPVPLPVSPAPVSGLVTSAAAQAAAQAAALPQSSARQFELTHAQYTLAPGGPTSARVGIIARNGRRKILNEVELLQSVSGSVECVLVRFEAMPFYRQVVLAHQLTVLVGVNGAGLMNGIYLPRDAVSVQLAPYHTDLNVREFGDFLKVRGPYVEWWNTHANNSFVLGSSSNTNTYVDVSEFQDTIAKALALGSNARLPKRGAAAVASLAAAPAPASVVPVAGASVVVTPVAHPLPVAPAPESSVARTPAISAAAPASVAAGAADDKPYRALLKPRTGGNGHPTVVVNVLVPHYNRTGFLTDMLRNLTLTRDTEFVVRVVDFNTHDLRTPQQREAVYAAAGVDVLAKHVLDAYAEPHVLSHSYADAMKGFEKHTGLGSDDGMGGAGAGTADGGIFDALEKSSGYPVVDWVRLPRQFSKGFGLHIGYSRIPPSTPERLQLVTVLDVDILVNSSYFDIIRAHVVPGRDAVMFCVLRDAYGKPLEVDDYSTGMVAFAREDAVRAGGLSSDKYVLRTDWGDEDNDILDRLRVRAGMHIVKVVNRGMIHRRHMRDFKDPWYCRSYWARGDKCPKSEEEEAQTKANLNANANANAAVPTPSP